MHTVTSPANIAFIKYWGRKNHRLFIPLNNNISMTMSGCSTTATIELSDKKEDQVFVKFFKSDYRKLKRESEKEIAIFSQIERIRELSGSKQKIRIITENNFPADSGIASSSSSFSAITSALLIAYNLTDLFNDKVELSRQIRLSGSASAVRSAMGGFVELQTANTHQGSHAIQIADENHWNLVNIVAVVNPQKKDVTTSMGHEASASSPYLRTRIREMKSRIIQCREAILEKDIQKLGETIEADAISMHFITMTSNPSIFYLNADSMELIFAIRKWRKLNGLYAYYTFDAGPNAHIICEANQADEIEKKLNELPCVLWTIRNYPCKGVYQHTKHLKFQIND